MFVCMCVKDVLRMGRKSVKKIDRETERSDKK